MSDDEGTPPPDEPDSDEEQAGDREPPEGAAESDPLRGLLPDHLADELILGVTGAVEIAYSDAATRFDKSIGCDGHTFGTDVWRFTWFRLEEWFRDNEEITTARPNGSLTIGLGGVSLKAYRGGSDADFKIEDFDLGDGSSLKAEIPFQNYEQLMIFGLFEDDEDANEDDAPGPHVTLVIVHTGNPEDRCTGIFIGYPLPGEWKWVIAVKGDVTESLGFIPFREGSEPVLGIELRDTIDSDVDEGYSQPGDDFPPYDQEQSPDPEVDHRDDADDVDDEGGRELGS